MKASGNQRLKVRAPRQQRSVQKVELILEATIQLLDKGGHDLVTTNAVAKTAGVSIGTLYQYFSSKEAILDALSSRLSDGALRGRNQRAGVVQDIDQEECQHDRRNPERERACDDFVLAGCARASKSLSLSPSL